jgi:hypothetical protein
MWEAIAQHALSFFGGVGVGLVLSSRYRIVRVNRKDKDDD